MKKRVLFLLFCLLLTGCGPEKEVYDLPRR